MLGTALHPRVDGDRGAQGPGDGLELALHDVVRVAAGEHRTCRHRWAWKARVSSTCRVSDPVYGTPPGPAADQRILLAGRLAAVHAVRPAGHVDHRLGQRLVQRHQGVAEPADAAPCRRARSRSAWPSDDRGVLDGVVGVDLRVAGGARPSGRSASAWPGRSACGRRSRTPVEISDAAGAVEVEAELDARLRRRPLELARTRLLTRCSPARRASTSSRRP